MLPYGDEALAKLQAWGAWSSELLTPSISNGSILKVDDKPSNKRVEAEGKLSFSALPLVSADFMLGDGGNMFRLDMSDSLSTTRY